MSQRYWTAGIWTILVALMVLAGAAECVWGAEAKTLNLDQCIAMAMENNQKRPASRFAVAVAEAQHRQALSGYWPQVEMQGGFMHSDEPPNFIFPAGNMYVPAQTIDVPASTFDTPGMSMTIPANTFGPGFPPVDVQIPIPPQTIDVPGQAIDVPAQLFPIPEQNIQLMDEDSWLASINAQWLLWDGGMRRGIRQQAQAGLDVAREDLRRTDLQITDSVRRLYYGAIMARQVKKVGQDTLARMEATLSLTETMYKEGSGRVMKTDYLDNKVMVETLRSTVALLEKNEDMAQAALAYTLGLAWHESVVPVDDGIPFHPNSTNLEALVGKAYEFNPDWKSIEAGIRAAEGALREAKSAHYPKLALTGELYQWWNDYDAGMATDINERGWTIGLGIQIPIFKGFLTRGKVKEARARLDKIRAERILLSEGIGLQVRDIVLSLIAAEKRYQATLDAMTSAVENRDLNTRAYQNDLVETDDVIKAQLIEALMSAQHYKMRYDHAELLSKLNLVVGTEVFRQLTGAE